MKGIDGKHALLKMGRAHLCVKWKNLFAKAKTLTVGEEAFVKGNAPSFGFYNQNSAFAFS